MTREYPSFTETFPNAVSPDTAVVVSDYPYGFELRCQKRYWVETKKGYGQRLVTQTSNPKKAGLVWNKPKAGTYSPLVVLYREPETGHIQATAWTPYDGEASLIEFALKYPLSDDQYKIYQSFLKSYAYVARQRAAAGERVEV